MKKFIQTFVLIFAVSLSFAQVQRVVLLEHFTQASCGPCATYNPAIETLLDNNEGDMVCINYHVSWPGFDPMYLHNPTDVDNRRGYYGVNSVPNSVLDGNYHNGHPADWGQADVDVRLGVSSPLSIELLPTFSQNYDSVYVTMNITAESAIGNAVKAHIVIVEKNIHFSTAPGTNHETDFSYVMKKMLPSANSMAQGETYTASGGWKIENLYQMNQVAVVGFVQNHSSQAIYQAGYQKLDFAAMLPLDISIKKADNILDKVCLSTIKPKIKIQCLGENDITELLFTYSFNNEDPQTYNWQGSLGFFESTLVELPEISYNQTATDNEFNVSVTNINGGTDSFEGNNILVKSFEKAPVATNTLLFNFKPDNDPEQTSWEFRKSAGSVLYEDGPYGEEQTNLIEKTFKINESGCYELTIFDSNGDGMQEGGFYKLDDINELAIVEGGAFLDKETTAIEIHGPPTLTANFPDSSTGIPIDTVIIFTFNEALQLIDDSPITDIEDYIALHERSIESPEMDFSATLSEDNTVVTITPANTLEYNRSYYVVVKEGLEGIINNFLPETILKLTTESEVSVFENGNKNTINMYPNPTSGDTKLSFESEDYDNYIVKMYNSYGQEVLKMYGEKNDEKEIININCNAFESGIYFVNLSIGEKNYNKKLVIKN
jgi:type IX secretion system substrate protein/Big-like domain-containing protein